MVAPRLFGPIDAVLGATLVGEVIVVEAVLFALVLGNVVTRRVAHGRHKREADDGPEAISRWSVHEATNVLLVVGAFYYTTIDQHAGVILSTLVLGLFITDFFEFEARKVEARREIPLEAPKGAIVASGLVVLYAGYQAVFFLIEPIYSGIV